MKLLVKMFLSVVMLTFVVGCGGGEGTGHTDDTTPGGEATPPADDLMDDKAFDDYSKKQGKG